MNINESRKVAYGSYIIIEFFKGGLRFDYLSLRRMILSITT